MGGLETFLSGGLMVVVYALLLVSIYRVFQIGSDVSEMKQLLKDIKRNTAPPDSRSPDFPPESPEALVRAVHSASYQDLDETIAGPRNPV